MPGNVARRGCFFCATAGKKGYKLLFKLSPHLTEKIRPTSNSKSLSKRQSRRMTHANKQPTRKNQTDKEATALVSSCKADGGVRHSLAPQNFGECNLPVDRRPLPHSFHSRPTGQLSEDHRDTAAQQKGSNLQGRIPPGIQDPSLNSTTRETKLAGSFGWR